MAMMDLIKQGAPLNPLSALRYFDLPEMDKLIAETEQMMAQQSQQAMIPYQVEMEKAKLAAAGKGADNALPPQAPAQ